MRKEAVPSLQTHFRGIFGDSLDRAVRRLRSHPYSPMFVRSDVSFEMPRIFNAYSGDISGRYIEFFSIYGQMGYDTDGLREMVQQVLKFQRPEGYFGVAGFDKSNLTHKETKIFWGNGRLLIGLLEYYRLSKDQNVLDAARRLGDFLFSCGVHERTSAISQAVARDTYSAGFATTFCSCIEGVVRLFDLTHDGRYATLAKGMADLLPDTFEGFHSHGRMTALRGMVDLAVATKDQAMLNRVTGQWQTIHDEHVIVLGGVRECFGYRCKRDEGCSVADWAMLSLKLLAVTGESKYLASAERCLFNHLPANQFQNGGFGHVPLAVDEVAGHDERIVAGTSLGGLTEAYWCCSFHGPRAILEAARHLMTFRDDCLEVAYVASAEVSCGDMRLELLADPFGQTLEIAVKEAQAGEFAIRVRVPAWAHEPEAWLPGETPGRIAPEDGYLTMTRRWQKNDVVRIELHPRFEVAPGVDTAQRSYALDKDALFYGRLLLGYMYEDDLLWGQEMRSDVTTVVLFEHRPQAGPVRFPYKTIVEYFDKAQNRTIWSPRELVPVMHRTGDQPLRTVHTIERRPWDSLTPQQQAELSDG